MMTRDEHLAWAKKRALACLPDVVEATARFVGDLDDHPELETHVVNDLIAMHIMGGLLNERSIRSLIEGTV